MNLELVMVDWLIASGNAGHIGGAKSIPIGTRSSSQFMDLLFTEDILKIFVANSNSYAKKQPNHDATKFKDFTVKHIRQYFAILLYMAMP